MQNGLNQSETELRKVSWKVIAAIHEYSSDLCSTLLSHLFIHTHILIEHLLY